MSLPQGSGSTSTLTPQQLAYINNSTLMQSVIEWAQCDIHDAKTPVKCFEQIVFHIRACYDLGLQPNKKAFIPGFELDSLRPLIEFIASKVSAKCPEEQSDIETTLWVEVGRYQNAIFCKSKEDMKTILEGPEGVTHMVKDITLKEETNPRARKEIELAEKKAKDDAEMMEDEGDDYEEEGEGDEGEEEEEEDEDMRH